MSVAHDRRRRDLAAAPNPPGQDEAVLLAAALGLALDGQPWQPGCVRCVRKAKTAEAEGEGLPPIAQSVTWLPNVGPVCYGCFG